MRDSLHRKVIFLPCIIECRMFVSEFYAKTYGLMERPAIFRRVPNGVSGLPSAFSPQRLCINVLRYRQ